MLKGFMNMHRTALGCRHDHHIIDIHMIREGGDIINRFSNIFWLQGLKSFINIICLFLVPF